MEKKENDETVAAHGSLTSIEPRASTASDVATQLKAVRTVCETLLQQEVLVLQFDIHHADLHQKLAGQSCKLKCRMNGKTFWKSPVHTAEKIPNKADTRLALNAMAKIVFESGEAIQFELCRPSFFRTKVVARCETPVSEVLASQHQAMDLEFTSVDGASSTVVANLNLDLRVLCEPLAAVGMSALRENPVSEIPKFREEMMNGGAWEIPPSKAAECKKFIEEAEKAKKCLQATLEAHRHHC